MQETDYKITLDISFGFNSPALFYLSSKTFKVVTEINRFCRQNET